MKIKTKDSRWSVFAVPDKFDEFLETREEIIIHKNAHKDIVSKFRLIQQLIDFSFYEYEFYDLAMKESLITLEAGLKIRYREITGNKWSNNKNLKQLLKWFFSRDYFEMRTEEQIDWLRKIRNTTIHTDSHSFGGVLIGSYPYQVAQIINETYYSDIPKRQERSRLLKELNLELLDMVPYGGDMLLSPNNKLIIEDVNVSFIDNRSELLKLHGFVRAVFNLDRLIDGNTYRIQGSVIPFELSVLKESFSSRGLLSSLKIFPYTERSNFLSDWQDKFKRKEIYPVFRNEQSREGYMNKSSLIKEITLEVE